ncbi:ABC-2 type transport system permease protein [Micromonospora sp. HB375]|uniref:ABC transporter permease n=1 Tax=Micromonospora TaxID=1873 RepID=UPI002378E634|nr:MULTISPECIES: ABC-2 family transporter protein [Micromonospora]MBP1782159.1 ABC-2 type transport system permease protein [Micromonospora sp. HB375]WDQ00236.1 ABC-2 family transporter protein [Micromonospora chalcea]
MTAGAVPLPADTRSRRIRAYRSMARMALKSLLAYQTSFLFGMLASAFGVLSMLYLWRSALAAGPRQGFDWPQMKAYLLVAFVVGSLVSSYTDYRMANRIQQGDVAMDLVRPVDYQWSRLAESVGFAVYEAGTAIVVVLAAAAIFGGMSPPDRDTLPLFILSALLVLPLRFGIVYLSGLLVFWTQNYVGVQAARIALITLFSGALVPLAFLPEWMRVIATYLPFVGMASTPALLYTGSLDGSDATTAVLVQAAWAVALWWLARLMWSAAARKLTVHGG